MNIFDIQSKQELKTLLKNELIREMYGMSQDYVTPGSNIDLFITSLTNVISKNFPSYMDYMDIEKLPIDKLRDLANLYNLQVETNVYQRVNMTVLNNVEIKQDTFRVFNSDRTVEFGIDNDIFLNKQDNISINVKLINNNSNIRFIGQGQLNQFSGGGGNILALSNPSDINLEINVRQRYIDQIKQQLKRNTLSDEEIIKDFIEKNIRNISSYNIDFSNEKLLINLLYNVVPKKEKYIEILDGENIHEQGIFYEILQRKSSNYYEYDIETVGIDKITDGIVTLLEGYDIGSITYSEIQGLYDLLQFARDNTQYGYNIDVKPKFIVNIKQSVFVNTNESLQPQDINRIKVQLKEYFQQNTVINKESILDMLNQTIQNIMFLDIGNYVISDDQSTYGNFECYNLKFDRYLDTTGRYNGSELSGYVPVDNDDRSILFNNDFGEFIKINLDPIIYRDNMNQIM